MVEKLRWPDGGPLVKAVRITSSIAPPKQLPDILVSTPAGLISAAREYKATYGYDWSQEGIVKRYANSQDVQAPNAEHQQLDWASLNKHF